MVTENAKGSLLPDDAPFDAIAWATGAEGFVPWGDVGAVRGDGCIVRGAG